MSVGGKNHRVLHMLYTLNNKGKGVLQQPQKKEQYFRRHLKLTHLILVECRKQFALTLVLRYYTAQFD